MNLRKFPGHLLQEGIRFIEVTKTCLTVLGEPSVASFGLRRHCLNGRCSSSLLAEFPSSRAAAQNSHILQKGSRQTNLLLPEEVQESLGRTRCPGFGRQQVSKFTRRAALRGKMRRVLCTTILINLMTKYVPDCLGKSICKVKQPRCLSGCDIDVSARCISQLVENLPIVNLRRQTTTLKLVCHPKMTNSGFITSQDNYFQ